MDKRGAQLLIIAILCGAAGLYLWNMHDKRIFLGNESAKILGAPLPDNVRIINGSKSMLWMEGNLTVFFEATQKDVDSMAASLKSVPYDVCAGRKNVPYINSFHPSECYYATESGINNYFTYIFWSLYEHKGVLYWVKT